MTTAQKKSVSKPTVVIVCLIGAFFVWASVSTDSRPPVTAAEAPHAPVIDITKIAGKSRAEVDAQLKAADACGKIKYGLKCEYGDKIEVVYIKGRADWITVKGLEHIPFERRAITSLGLSDMSPSAVRPTVLRWEPIPGFKSIAIFKGQTGSDYAYIKVATE